ncbi:phytanoyl-CoA dioxygenase family protein [Novosphingobium sp. SL115]|uniref:phytanoyl-CoA dioxygenase family protein n=1 Tax=Novosphingobium sp. SL115 TaxID=2995150 RepID=UPI0022760BE0|nr:phytanoyl-CoA dioxygenase family protein [Novosphingobium sp. SL115]MCY1669439.1 phytanoyl-CoA dioxygenase family protein [Novosphingobium sp. SL115]
MTVAPIEPWLTELLVQGYCVIPALQPAEVLADLRQDLDVAFETTPFGQGDFYGYRTKRFGSLLRRSSRAAHIVMEPTVLALAEAVLGSACDRIQLNVAQAIAIHPGEVEQFPHCDQDMWAGVKGAHEYLLNVIWPLDPFTSKNGATRIYPGTHRDSCTDLSELPEPVIATCEPGSAICFLGSTLHGAGSNSSTSVRRAIVVGYSLGWLKPYENLWLAYPPQVAKAFSPELAALVGYAQHRPNLGNYEGQCPSVLLSPDLDGPLGAIDALRPDQAAIVAGFARRRTVQP